MPRLLRKRRIVLRSSRRISRRVRRRSSRRGGFWGRRSRLHPRTITNRSSWLSRKANCLKGRVLKKSARTQYTWTRGKKLVDENCGSTQAYREVEW